VTALLQLDDSRRGVMLGHPWPTCHFSAMPMQNNRRIDVMILTLK
jgi:hypothetical protein